MGVLVNNETSGCTSSGCTCTSSGYGQLEIVRVCVVRVYVVGVTEYMYSSNQPIRKEWTSFRYLCFD